MNLTLSGGPLPDTNDIAVFVYASRENTAGSGGRPPNRSASG
jgi:hypothetical protein